MWYAADKYVRLLEQNKKELGLNSPTKTDRKHEDTSASKKKDSTGPKGKSASKRSTKNDPHEGDEKTNVNTLGENKDEDATETAGRRRSSRVARNEAIAKQAQENAEKNSDTKGKGEEADTEEGSRKKGSPKKQAKEKEVKVEVNGENHGEDGEKERVVNEENEEGEKTPWRPVYLTRSEVDGLTKLIDRLRNWPQAKKNVPETLEDPEGLLKSLEVCATLVSSLIKIYLFQCYAYLQAISLNIRGYYKSFCSTWC